MYTVYVIVFLEIPLLVSTWSYFSSQYFVIILKSVVLPLFFSAVNLTLKNRRHYSVFWFSFPISIFSRTWWLNQSCKITTEHKPMRRSNSLYKIIHLSEHCPCDATRIIHSTTYSLFLNWKSNCFAFRDHANKCSLEPPDVKKLEI